VWTYTYVADALKLVANACILGILFNHRVHEGTTKESTKLDVDTGISDFFVLLGDPKWLKEKRLSIIDAKPFLIIRS